jgi:hypothetical protein
MLTPQELADQIDLHLQKTGESRTAFGWKICRDPNLVFQLRKGRDVGLRLAGKITEEIKLPFILLPSLVRAAKKMNQQ